MKIVRYHKCVALLRAACLLTCLGHHAPAQQQQPPPPPPILSLQAQKFDEFGDILLTDIAARLDYFATEIQARPDARGFIIVYRSRRDIEGLSGRLAGWMKDYLERNRRFAPGRIVGVDGGVAECLAQELWIVPVGATPVPRREAYQSEYEDTDGTRMFDETHPSTGENMGGSYSSNVLHTLDGFANALRRQPRAHAHVIVYAAYRVNRWEEGEGRARRTHRSVWRDPPGAARKELNLIKAELVKKYSISPSRIRLVDGGHSVWSGVELWVVPRGAHAPVPTPNAFPKGRR